MNNPWQEEKVVDIDLAEQLIEDQFPDANLLSIEYLGRGFDNTAFLVNKSYVFRFPRKDISVKLIKTEMEILPVLKRWISIPVCEPIFFGEPSSLFGWPFAGYRFLPGHGADFFQLNTAERTNLAQPIGKMLKQLHTSSVTIGKAFGLGPDPLDRFNVAERYPKILELILRVQNVGLFDKCDLLKKMLDQIKPIHSSEHMTIVHGDLYSRHLLLDDTKKLCGVIDWGDVHIGNPAVDLSLLYAFLPKSAWPLFIQEYGVIADDVLQAALFRAINQTLYCVLYSHDVQDLTFLKEATTALHLIVDHAQ